MEILRNVVAGLDSYSLELMCGARLELTFDPKRLVEAANRSRIVISPSLLLKIKMGMYPQITPSHIESRERYCATPKSAYPLIRYPVFSQGSVEPRDVYLRLSPMEEGKRFADYLIHDLLPRSNRTVDKAEMDRLRGVGRKASLRSLREVLGDNLGYLWYDSSRVMEAESDDPHPDLSIRVYTSFLGADFLKTSEVSKGQIDYLMASHNRC